MKIQIISLVGLLSSTSYGFQTNDARISSNTALFSDNLDRRSFGNVIAGSTMGILALNPQSSSAKVFLDPAMYGDQELRVGTVDSIRESVRRAILQKPALVSSFYQLALLDCLSYDSRTDEYGPDGRMLRAVLALEAQDDYTRNLQEASLALISAAKILKAKTAVTIADAIAVAGAESIESIGGPVLPTQLGRTDAPSKEKPSSFPPVDLFSGKRPVSEISDAFKRAGLTEREMTALLLGLMTIEQIEKSRTTDDWKQSSKQRFRERGKMGRMSEFRAITEEDIKRAEEEEDDDYEDPDDGQYIADSFGGRDERFGQRLGKDDITEKTFNKYVKELDAAIRKKGGGDISPYGTVGTLLADTSSPTTQLWVNKYATSNISYLKDLGVAYNAATQLGAAYTGGKYESLLKNKPRKTLNDDGLNLF